MIPLSVKIEEQLRRLPTPTAYRIAFSGGLDSTVLLHVLARLRERLAIPVAALHVDHGLHPDATAWAGHCREVAALLGVELTCLAVRVPRDGGGGLEAEARAARYRALQQRLGPGEALLTAHHQDDQAETVLLQLLRGAGSRGLAAMPAARRLGRGWLLRPLLGYSRAQLHGYAQEQGLDWIDDPSNADTGLERNFVRHDILPRLTARRAGAVRALARSAERLAEDAELLRGLADADLAQARGMRPGTVAVAALRRVGPARARNLLRHWLRERGLPVPGEAPLERLLHDLARAPADAEPCVCWAGAEVRRYRDDLYAHPPLPPEPPADWRAEWDLLRPLALPPGLGTLVPRRVIGRGLSPARLSRVTVRCRGAAMRCRPRPDGPSRELKKLWQERSVPPWVRVRTPLLCVADEPVAVPGVCVAAGLVAGEGETGVEIVWIPGGALAEAGSGPTIVLP